MDKHTQERNFSCEICSLKFKSTNSLRIHKRRHLPVEATKPCPTCGKEFRSSAALSNHKLVHSNEKKHKCIVSAQEFFLLINLFALSISHYFIYFIHSIAPTPTNVLNH